MNELTIYDAEQDQMVEINQEQRGLAAMCHQQVLLGAFMSAMALKRVFDERLYLALGCQTRDEYIGTMLPFGRAQALKLYSIAVKVDGVYKSLNSNNNDLAQLPSSNFEISSTKVDENSSKNAVTEAELSTLGVNKLYELVKIDDSDLKTLIKKGKVKTGDEELDWETLKDMTARDMAVQIQKATGKYKEDLKKKAAKIAQLKEDNKLLTAEAKLAKQMLERAKEIEATYGAVASKTEDKREAITRARMLLNDFQETMARAGVNEDDAETLRKDLINVIQRVDEVYAIVRELYGAVILSTGE